MYVHVCNICKKNVPDAKIKYKYRAKKFWWAIDAYGWERIELCQECLDKIIEADKKSEKEDE